MINPLRAIIISTCVLLTLPAMPVQSQAPLLRSELDCGTLRGVGVVTIYLDRIPVIVPVECGQAPKRPA